MFQKEVMVAYNDGRSTEVMTGKASNVILKFYAALLKHITN